MSALDDYFAGLNKSSPSTPVVASSPTPSTPTTPTTVPITAPASTPKTSSPIVGPVESSDFQSAGGQTPNPITSAPTQSTTQNWNGQQIPAGIATKNLVAYDAKTGNKTFSLPTFAGGGVYTEDANDNLVNTGHSSYGGEPAVAGQERDDIIPVSLGGTNVNAQNIRDVPMSIAAPQDTAETAMAKAVKSGAVQPKAGITDILSKKTQIAGNLPAQGTGANLLPALKDMFLGMVPAVSEPILQSIERTGTKGVDVANAIRDLVQSGGKPSLKATEDLNAPGDFGTNFLTGQSEKVNPTPDTIRGNLQAGMDAVNPAALVTGLEGGVADTGETPMEKPTETPTPQTIKAPPETPKSLKDVTPEYNGKTMDASDKITNAKGETQYRLNAPKTLGSTTVNPDASEVASAQEVDKLPDYSKVKTFTDKAQVVDTGISNEAEQMRGGLQIEDKANPLDAETEKTKMVQATHDALPEDMKAKVDAGKPLPNTKAGQYYQTTLDNANSYDGTREGKLDVRQANDKAYLSARGKLAFGDNDLNALDDSNKGLRTSINKDLANTSQTDTGNSLNKQSKLYDARDVLNDKAKSEATFKGRHPLVSKLGTREVMSATTGALAGGLLGGSFTTAGKNAVNAVKGEVNKLRGISTTKPVKPKAPKAPPKLKL